MKYGITDSMAMSSEEYAKMCIEIAVKRADELVNEWNNMDDETIYDELSDSIDIEVRADLNSNYRSAEIGIGSDVWIDTSDKTITYSYAGFKESRGLSSECVDKIDFIIEEWFKGC